MTTHMFATSEQRSTPVHMSAVGDLAVPASHVPAFQDAVTEIQRKSLYRPEPLPAEIMRELVGKFYDGDWAVARYVSEVGVGKINGHPGINFKDLETQHTIKQGKPTDQKSSGRCWIYSGLNVMRPAVLEEYGSDFEYSQNYVAFWDKMERANFFLEKMIEMGDLPPDNQRLMNLIEHCFTDGGEWELFRNVVEKYGVVPKHAMPETEFSGRSGGYMSSLKKFLREQGAILHMMASTGSDPEVIQFFKRKLIAEVGSTLTKYLGKPPEKFTWKNKDGEFEQITPLEFYERSPIKLRDMVHLSNLPYHPEGMVIEVKDVGNVVEGDPMRALNVSIDMLKEAIRNSIKSGRSVLFASEVAELDRNANVFATDVDRSRQILVQHGIGSASKGVNLRYQATCVAHGMAIIGCDDADHARVKDAVPGTPEVYTGPIWKIENSWKGMEVIFASDKWMDEYLYGIVVHKDDLPAAAREILESPLPPTKKVPAYDPFGRI